MSKIQVTLNIDDDRIREESGQATLEDAIRQKLGWLHDSGMYVEDWSFQPQEPEKVFLFEENRSRNRMGRPGDANNVYYSNWYEYYTFNSAGEPCQETKTLEFSPKDIPLFGGGESRKQAIEAFRTAHPTCSVIVLDVEYSNRPLKDRMADAVRAYEKDNEAVFIFPAQSARSSQNLDLQSFYYTFGTADSFPFKGGWLEVQAEDRAQADKLFRSKYPDRTPGVLNCAFVYDKEEFDRILEDVYKKYPNDRICHGTLLQTEPSQLKKAVILTCVHEHKFGASTYSSIHPNHRDALDNVQKVKEECGFEENANESFNFDFTETVIDVNQLPDVPKRKDRALATHHNERPSFDEIVKGAQARKTDTLQNSQTEQKEPER